MSAPPHHQHAALAATRHGFFGRRGGVSDGIYASLNVGRGSDDSAANVSENRRLIQQTIRANALVTAQQTHSARAVILGADCDVSAPFSGDALVTARQGVAIGVLTADCAPILFYEPHAKIIGAAHAGWRGAHDGIIAATLAAIEKLGGAPQHVSAVIGPTISRYAYEVGADFKARFAGYEDFFTAQGAAMFFDLMGFVTARLTDAGVRPTQIHNLDICTYWQAADYFSNRRRHHQNEADYGRQLSVICL